MKIWVGAAENAASLELGIFSVRKRVVGMGAIAFVRVAAIVHLATSDGKIGRENGW